MTELRTLLERLPESVRENDAAALDALAWAFGEEGWGDEFLCLTEEVPDCALDIPWRRFLKAHRKNRKEREDAQARILKAILRLPGYVADLEDVYVLTFLMDGRERSLEEEADLSYTVRNAFRRCYADFQA